MLPQLGLVLAVSVVAPPATTQVEPTSVESLGADPPAATQAPEDLYLEGSRLFSAGEYTTALGVFTDGVRLYTQRGDARWLAYFRGALVQCHLEAYDVDGEPSHLRLARDQLQRALEGAERLDTHDRDELMRWASLAQARLDEHEVAGPPAEPPTLESTPAPTPEPDSRSAPLKPVRSDPIHDQQPRRPPNWRLIGGSLVSVGAATSVFGIGGIIYAALGRSIVEGQAEGDLGPVQAEYVNETVPKLQRTWYAVGGGSIALGAAATTVGAIILARHPKRPDTSSRLTLQTTASRRSAGLRLSGRF